VQHHGHIGIVNGQFSADNLPKEWKDQLKAAGVRKKDLNNPELRDLLFGLILAEGGKLVDDLEAQEAQQQAQPLPALPSNGHAQALPPQPNPNNPYSQKAAPPTPQARPNSQAAQSLPQPANNAILFNPGPSSSQPQLPPPMQPQTPFVPSGGDDAPMKRGYASGFCLLN
jgi:hypothetical protein